MELSVGLPTGGLGEGGSRDAGRGWCRQGRCRGAHAGVRGDDEVAPRGRAGVLDAECWTRRRGPWWQRLEVGPGLREASWPWWSRSWAAASGLVTKRCGAGGGGGAGGGRGGGNA